MDIRDLVTKGVQNLYEGIGSPSWEKGEPYRVAAGALMSGDPATAKKVLTESPDNPNLSPENVASTFSGGMVKAGLPMVLAGLRGAKPRVAMTSDGYRFIEKPDGSWETADGMGFPDFQSLVEGLDDPHLTLDGKIYDEVARQRDIKEMGYDTMQHGMPPGWADFMVPGPEERAIAAQRRRSQMTLVPPPDSIETKIKDKP